MHPSSHGIDVGEPDLRVVVDDARPGATVIRRAAIVYADPDYEAGIESVPAITPEELRIALTYPTSDRQNDS